MPVRVPLKSGEVVSAPAVYEHEAFAGEHNRPAEDWAWLASLSRRDAVSARAPGMAEAWALTETAGLRTVVPVSLEQAPYAATAPPFTSGLEVVDHYANHPDHGAGIITGAQGDGWGLVALRDESGGNAWRAWAFGSAVPHPRMAGRVEFKGGALVETIDKGPDWADRTEDRGTILRSVRPHGQAVMVAWHPYAPPDEPWSMPKPKVLRGNVNPAALEPLRQLATAPGSGGSWLLFAYRGEWHFPKRRHLAEGLSVWPSGAVVPVSGILGRSRLLIAGGGSALLCSGHEESAGHWCPPWLLSMLGGRPA